MGKKNKNKPEETSDRLYAGGIIRGSGTGGQVGVRVENK